MRVTSHSEMQKLIMWNVILSIPQLSLADNILYKEMPENLLFVTMITCQIMLYSMKVLERGMRNEKEDHG